MCCAIGGCDDNCIDHCPKTRTLVVCEAVATLNVDDVVAASETLVGTVISVRGRVGQGDGVCTQLGCFDGCCNSCSADLVVRGDAGAGLVLRSASDDLRCDGDESRLCCPLALDAEVVVQGTLAEDPGGLRGPTLVLEGATACTPR